MGVTTGEVVDEGAGHTVRVDAVVGVEAPVFNRDDGVLHDRRDLFRLDNGPSLSKEARHDVSIGVQHPGLFRRLNHFHIGGELAECRGYGFDDRAPGTSGWQRESSCKGPQQCRYQRDSGDDSYELNRIEST